MVVCDGYKARCDLHYHRGCLDSEDMQEEVKGVVDGTWRLSLWYCKQCHEVCRGCKGAFVKDNSRDVCRWCHGKFHCLFQKVFRAETFPDL